jgi:hypothetical protein
VLRLRREPPLLGRANRPLQAKRPPTRTTPNPPRPPAWGGRAMPTVMGEGIGGVYGVRVLAWSTQQLVGSSAGRPGPAAPWVEALALAVPRQGPAGARGQGGSWRRDHGGQPTARACLRAGATLASQQAGTRDTPPKGQADPGRGRRPRQAACRGRHAWTCPWALGRALAAWVHDDQAPYVPAALADKTPKPWARDSDTRHGTPCVAA